MIKEKITYEKVFITVFSMLTVTALNNLFLDGSFLGISYYVSLLYFGMNPLLATLIYLSGFVYGFKLKTFYSALISAIALYFIFSLYGKKKRKPKGELILFILLSEIGFLLIRESLSLVYTLIEGGVAVVLSLIFITSTRSLFFKKLNYKPSVDEILCVFIFVAFLELGLTNLFGVNTVKSINIFLILLSSALSEFGFSVAVAVLLSTSTAVFYKSLIPVAIYGLLGIVPSVFMKKSRLIASLFTIFCDLIFVYILKSFGTPTYFDILYDIVPVTVFLFLPSRFLSELNQKISLFGAKNLPKYAVNKMRLNLSGKLYGIAEIFSEMERSFSLLKETTSTDEDLIGRMVDEVMINVCSVCPNYVRCMQKGEPKREDLFKIISVGIAKNKISLVDLTKRFTENCGYLNSVIFEMNRLIGKYREKVKENEELLSGKELIRMQSEGVSEVLKGMAFDYSRSLSFCGVKEKKLADILNKNGIMFNEIMVLGDGENYEINLSVKNEDLNLKKLLSVIDGVTKKINAVVSKTSVSATTSYLTVRPSPNLDAAFGISTKVKTGSEKSGDTHSLTKIDEGKFLIALSDGMGSGIRAETTSKTALSLIESFYKAGLDSNLILSMVNKILAVSADDNFSAIDMITVNLFDLTADFIKIGAPTSFILTDSAIKIIEGNSLPLGILDDLTPSGCSVELQEGSTVVLLTDGVADAFGSSTDIVDFLRTLENKNPQYITDSILEKALNNNRGTAEDDMTVLAVRIFKKIA